MSAHTAQLTLLRHGKSVWNKENRFTGWVDVPLAAEGVQEARAAAAAMRRAGLVFDAAFASNLRRALATLWLVLEETEQMWLPQHSDWRLNERHYGALQGLNKEETTAKHGAEQVQKWRRSVGERPPPLTGEQPALAGVQPPTGESLQDVIPRVRAVYEERIAPQLAGGASVLVVAHGNSLRALIKQLEGISEEEIMQVEVATGTPWVYALGADGEVQDKKILACDTAGAAE